MDNLEVCFGFGLFVGDSLLISCLNFLDRCILFSHFTVGGIWGLLYPKLLPGPGVKKAVKGFWFLINTPIEQRAKYEE